MRFTKNNRRTGAAGLSVLLLALTLTATLLFTAAVSAIELPQSRENFSARESGSAPGSDPLLDGLMPDSGMMSDTEGNLGDTAPGEDSLIGDNDGFIEGTSDSAAASDLPGSDSAGDTATDTAGTSSGAEDNGGMSVFGVVITVVIILAVLALIIALIPKKKSM